MYAISFLVISNLFMTAAWYGHLKWFKEWPMWQVVLVSWGIAFAEYCFQVPANRIGYTVEKFSLPQLKTIQEIITLLAFVGFAIVVNGQRFRWNHAVGLTMLLVGAFFIFQEWK